MLGGKTGFNNAARYCLVLAARVGGRTLAMAFLGTEGELTRFGDVARVSDWVVARRARTTAAALAGTLAPTLPPTAPAREPEVVNPEAVNPEVVEYDDLPATAPEPATGAGTTEEPDGPI